MAEAAKAKSDLLQNLRLSIKEHDAQAFLIPHDDAHSDTTRKDLKPNFF